MKLMECHVENFGKLRDITVKFEKGYQLFCEPNGWGKSTLAVFLRVMLFGFDGETRRKEGENERKRYQPWQGGVYGGQIVFEAGEKRYQAVRIFGNKKQNDVFELRDADTNLESSDFSENLGEELFGINSESFQRTVFIGQNDCMTHTTDSINARIGNLADNMDDLNRYEKALGVLQEQMNRLNPRRKTGEIYQLSEKITGMQTEIAAGESLGASIEQAELAIARERNRLKQKKEEQKKLKDLGQRISRAKDLEGMQMVYRQLCEDCAAKEETVKMEEDRFPAGVPLEPDLQEWAAACERMDHIAGEMQKNRLTEEEFYQFENWRSIFEEKHSAGEETAPEAGKEAGNKSRKRTGQIGMVIPGIVLAVLGVGFCPHLLSLGIALILAGVIFIIFGLYMIYSGKQRTSENVYLRELAAREGEFSEYYGRYRKLVERQETYQELCRQYTEEQQKVYDGLREWSIIPAKNLKRQVQELLLDFTDWKYSTNYLREAQKKKRDFEAAHNMEQILGVSGEGMQSLEEWNRQGELLNEAAEEIQSSLQKYEKQLEGLRESYDIWKEEKKQLETELGALAAKKETYRYIQKAREYLIKAKENLTARYREPLMNRFSWYYEMIMDRKAKEYVIDANTNITVKEQGMQRDVQYLSAGWKDLTGFCMRLALADVMYPEEKPFLILDDPFANLDDEKMRGARRLLEEAAKEYQIIYFTCSESRV